MGNDVRAGTLIEYRHDRLLCLTNGQIPYKNTKLSVKAANELHSILTKINITQSKVKIDLHNDTIEVDDDYPIDDILAL